MASIFLSAIAIAVVGSYIVWKVGFQSNSTPLPPGPKGLPIVGNIRDLPPPGAKEWEHWLKHKDLYGPISSVTMLGQTLIILNDRQCAIDLLGSGKNSIKTASRPRPVMAYEFAGYGKSITLVDLKTYNHYRKAISKVIGSRSAVSKFNHMQDLEASRFLWRVLQSPEDYASHLETEAGAFILKVSYGYSVAPHGIDPLVALAKNGLKMFETCATPGNWMVNVIPSMRYIPEWFPGGEFKKKGREIAHALDAYLDRPLAFTRYQKAQNCNEPSYASDLMDQNEDADVVKWTSSAMYMAGADTTVSSLKGFLLALLLHPEVQQAAQAEIDRIIGPDRLPTLADRDSLPYIEALLKEVHRWHTVAPMGLAHQADEDIIYNGFLIPKGAVLMANAWAYCHDPEIYPNPRKFSPERYLINDGHEPEPDPRDVSFGFGRRVCPGRFIADTAIFVTMAQTLAAYHISKPVGNDGREIEPTIDYTPGFVTSPVPFQCAFTLRSPKYEDLIRAVEREHPFGVGDADILEAASVTEREGTGI